MKGEERTKADKTKNKTNKIKPSKKGNRAKVNKGDIFFII